ncbi:hypothetical protein [Halobacillus salinus]|uniref:hypothetical protein n=1 Tax=Halobacillus salinus TaxID=192814 RepID=UPI0009A8744D|nr:hypothetical protein [Halobacillus salinus]
MDFVQSFTFSEEELQDLIYAIETTLGEQDFGASYERSVRLEETLRLLRIHSQKHDQEKNEEKRVVVTQRAGNFQSVDVG